MKRLRQSEIRKIFFVQKSLVNHRLKLFDNEIAKISMMLPCEVIKMLEVEDDDLFGVGVQELEDFIDWIRNFDAVNTVDEIEEIVGLIEGCSQVEVSKNLILKSF